MAKVTLQVSLESLNDLLTIGELTSIEALHRAAALGADQELTECCDHLKNNCCSVSMEVIQKFYQARRPTLKQQSIALLDKIQNSNSLWQLNELDVIREALKNLPE